MFLGGRDPVTYVCLQTAVDHEVEESHPPLLSAARDSVIFLFDQNDQRLLCICVVNYC